MCLQGKLDAINVEKAIEFVLSCMNFDGGFGCRPGSESHAGQVIMLLTLVLQGWPGQQIGKYKLEVNEWGQVRIVQLLIKTNALHCLLMKLAEHILCTVTNLGFPHPRYMVESLELRCPYKVVIKVMTTE